LLIGKKEKEKLVIELANQGKPTREIAKQVHISLKDIGKIIHKVTGDEFPSPENKEKELEKEKQRKLKSLSSYARAFQMFKDKKSLADVTIELDIKSSAVLDFYNDYLCLLRMNSLVTMYKELKKDFPLLLHLYHRIKEEGLNKQDMTDLLQNHNKLIDLNEQVKFYNNHIRKQQAKIQDLAQIINRLNGRIDNYDGIT
jgi:septal ring factor EnvC (AmiA/AmiB activator)